MKRDRGLDLSKFIGMTGIIIAHCNNIPVWIDYIRHYEVITLILVSAVLYSRSFIQKKEYEGLILSISRRIKRIVFPTWFFVSVVIGSLFIASLITNRPFPYDLNTIIESYAMINGIGYVWIMLVYVFIGIGMPFIVIGINRSGLKQKQIWALLCVSYLFYELLRCIIVKNQDNYPVMYYIKNTILYFLIYNIISVSYIYLEKEKKRIRISFSALLLAGHFLSCLFTDFPVNILVGRYKYPPSFFYLLYSFGIAILIVEICDSVKDKFAWADRFLTFSSKNSQWIYFNHVLCIYIWNEFFDSDKWGEMFCFLFVGAYLLTLLNEKMVKVISAGKFNVLKSFVKNIF